MLFILESFTFFFVSHDHVTCDINICDNLVINITLLSYFVTYVIIILHSLLKSKIEIKSSLLFTTLILEP